ncbi:MAG: hypothetical protein FWC26_00820 [Fibromonadales bacterium]|nr:hypothetical protein [Fibromonadales bacterium]
MNNNPNARTPKPSFGELKAAAHNPPLTSFKQRRLDITTKKEFYYEQ